MPQKAHMIVPWEETIHLTPFHTIRRKEVRLDPDDAHWLAGRKGQRELMLSKVQLESIAEAAGIDTILSEPVETKHEEIILWHYAIQVEGPDGKSKRLDRWYELDLRLKERDGVDGGFILFARSQARSKADKIRAYPKDQWKQGMPEVDDDAGWEEWINDRALNEWTAKRRHRIRLAETGAYLAAIRSKCRIKSVYKEEEFEVPWAVYRPEFDMTRAIQAGGEIGRMALAAAGVSMTQSLGLPKELADHILESMGEVRQKGLPAPENELLNAPEEDIKQLEEAMIDAGFGDRASCDKRSNSIFGIPLSQLTNRHVSLMHEYITFGKLALENVKDKDEMRDFTEHLAQVMNLAYASGGKVEDLMEEQWWNKIHGAAEEEPEEEDGETIDGEAVTLDEAMEGKTPQAGDTV